MLEDLPIAKGRDVHAILPRMANRHGLIAGATGTGKTVTLRVIAESFSRAGMPVFMADVKGDLSGIARPMVAARHTRERDVCINGALIPNKLNSRTIDRQLPHPLSKILGFS